MVHTALASSILAHTTPVHAKPDGVFIVNDDIVGYLNEDDLIAVEGGPYPDKCGAGHGDDAINACIAELRRKHLANRTAHRFKAGAKVYRFGWKSDLFEMNDKVATTDAYCIADNLKSGKCYWIEVITNHVHPEANTLRPVES